MAFLCSYRITLCCTMSEILCNINVVTLRIVQKLLLNSNIGMYYCNDYKKNKYNKMVNIFVVDHVEFELIKNFSVLVLKYDNIIGINGLLSINFKFIFSLLSMLASYSVVLNQITKENKIKK